MSAFGPLLAWDTGYLAFGGPDPKNTCFDTCFVDLLRVCPRLDLYSLGTRATSRSGGLMTQKHVFRHVFRRFPSSMSSFGPLLARDTGYLAFGGHDDPETCV